MKTVLVVGAGGSVAEAGLVGKASTPPLDKTFFAHCSSAKYNQLGPVRNGLREIYGIDVLDEPEISLEQLFTMVFSHVFQARATTQAKLLLWNLIRLYARAIGESTNWIHGKKRGGLRGILRAIFDLDGKLDVSIITYNHDLVIEKVLQGISRKAKYSSTVPFSIDRAYVHKFDQYGGVSGHSQVFSTGLDRSIEILKLHGSLNWFWYARSARDPENTLREPTGPLFCSTSMNAFRGLIGRRPGTKRRRPMIPLIVPPMYEKAQKYARVLGPLRERAAEKLRECERLICFGYSFPEADAGSWALLRSSLSSNKTLKQSFLLNPDWNIGKQFWKAVGK